MKKQSLISFFLPLLFFSSCSPEKAEDLRDVTCITCTETEAPSNPSITINGGNAGTNSTEVTLTLSASDNTGIRGYYVSENSTAPDKNDAGWIEVSSAKDYSDTVSFTLSSGEGPKPVTAWFKDYVGSISPSVNTTAPWNPSISIKGDADNSNKLILTLSASDDDGITGYYVSLDTIVPSVNDSEWVSVPSTTSYSDNVSFIFSSGTNKKTVSVWFKDAVGNISTSASATYNTFYTDIGDGTVSELNTGLMWQQEDDGTRRNWNDAGTYCRNLSLSATSDWRLPSKEELFSLVDTSFGKPTIDTRVFPNTKSSFYWTSTVYAPVTTNAWLVGFNGGYVNYGNQTGTSYVRCVR